MIDCECIEWAVTDGTEHLMGNGHNPRCGKFVAGIGGIELLRELVKGIRFWASQEDGIPDELWEPFKKAVFITEGRMPPDEQE